MEGLVMPISTVETSQKAQREKEKGPIKKKVVC